MVNDTVEELPVVVVAPDETTLVGYDRRVAGDPRHFSRASTVHLRPAGSRWKVTSGRAIDGPHEGTVLMPATDEPQMHRFAWESFHPENDVYTPDG